MLFMCSLDLNATQWRLIMIQRVIFISKEWSFECYSKEPNLTSVKCTSIDWVLHQYSYGRLLLLKDSRVKWLVWKERKYNLRLGNVSNGDIIVEE